MKLNDYGIIIQARMASTRLPGKTLLPLNNGTILDSVISRCSKSICKKIIVATSKNMEDDLIEEHCRMKKYLKLKKLLELQQITPLWVLI